RAERRWAASWAARWPPARGRCGGLIERAAKSQSVSRKVRQIVQIMTETLSESRRKTSGVCVLHDAVPGRVRLHVPLLRRKPRTAERLAAHLSQMPGVRVAQTSAVTGS